jgi:hypothetical protein
MPAQPAYRSLPGSKPVFSFSRPTRIYGWTQDIPCGGTCPQWSFFGASRPAVSSWNQDAAECEDRAEAVMKAADAWLLPEPTLAWVPGPVLRGNPWALRVRRARTPEVIPWELGIPGGPGVPAYDQGLEEVKRYPFLRVLELEAVQPVRICRGVESTTFSSPAAKGALVVESEPRALLWVAITGPDPSFVRDVVWMALPEEGRESLEVRWSAAGDEATLTLAGRARLRVHFEARRADLLVADPGERAALDALEKIRLRASGWSLRAVRSLEP